MPADLRTEGLWLAQGTRAGLLEVVFKAHDFKGRACFRVAYLES